MVEAGEGTHLGEVEKAGLGAWWWDCSGRGNCMDTGGVRRGRLFLPERE